MALHLDNKLIISMLWHLNFVDAESLCSIYKEVEKVE